MFIKSAKKSLGFSIAGGKGGSRGDSIYVRNIDPVGPAAQDGRLKMGDEILEVNSQQLKGCTHQEAANIIKVSGTCFLEHSISTFVPSSYIAYIDSCKKKKKKLFLCCIAYM